VRLVSLTARQNNSCATGAGRTGPGCSLRALLTSRLTGYQSSGVSSGNRAVKGAFGLRLR